VKILKINHDAEIPGEGRKKVTRWWSDLSPHLYHIVLFVVSLYHSKALIRLHVKVKQYHFSGAHPASYTMGIRSFLGVKRPGRGIDHPPPRIKKE